MVYFKWVGTLGWVLGAFQVTAGWAASRPDQTVCLTMMSASHSMAFAATVLQDKKERTPASEKRSPEACQKDAEKVTDLALDFSKIPGPCQNMMVTDIKKENRKLLRKMASLPSGQVANPMKNETLAAYTSRLMKARYWEQCVGK
ncbi:MAG: hypothetical protein JNL01_04205 [Bdellovibrionales bacterium]|nr:hypothetical protein [Bdellovibrionales bacterium]